MTQINYAHITMVLDKSGSMSDNANSTISGVNELITSQLNLIHHKTTFSLIEFNGSVHTSIDFQDIKAVPLRNRSNYIPDGVTALYDAIGIATNLTGKRLASIPESLRPSQVKIIIVTDGYENSSVEYTSRSIKEIIEHQTEKYNWEFIFMGTNQDAALEAGKIGIKRDYAITYANNAQGVKAVYSSVTNNISNSRLRGTAASFNENDRQQQEEAAQANNNSKSFSRSLSSN